jgi:hypothetical protein
LALGGWADILKWAFYAALALATAWLLWKHRGQLIQAIADLLRELRELLARLLGGGRSAADGLGTDERSSGSGPRHRAFAEFQDPFATGTYQRLPPDELVRYTFEAFEAWARDRGHSRTLDQTPHELVQRSIARQTPMYTEARRMAELYSEAAYGAGGISHEAAGGLREVWKLMRAAQNSA